MGLLKKILNSFSCKCKSNCAYNNTEFDTGHLTRKLTEYKLKYKDMKEILRILNKRELYHNDEETNKKITEI